MLLLGAEGLDVGDVAAVRIDVVPGDFSSAELVNGCGLVICGEVIGFFE